MTEDEVKQRVCIAIQEFMENDSDLLILNSSERSVTHRLAVYLEKQFQHEHWNVDCEYNRIHKDPKMLDLFDLKKKRRVFPDIIVHKRGKKQNLLVVEVKKGRTNKQSEEFDRIKLRYYKSQPTLGYPTALFLKFSNGSHPKPILEWIDD